MRSVALSVCLMVAAAVAAEESWPKESKAASVPAVKKAQAYLGLEFRWQSGVAVDRNLHVERVAPSGPADRAGLRPGDIVTHIGGVPVGFGDELDFLIFMRDRIAGERLVLNIVRSGRHFKMVATLGALPEAARPTWERGFRIAQQKRQNAGRRDSNRR